MLHNDFNPKLLDVLVWTREQKLSPQERITMRAREQLSAQSTKKRGNIPDLTHDPLAIIKQHAAERRKKNSPLIGVNIDMKL